MTAASVCLPQVDNWTMDQPTERAFQGLRAGNLMRKSAPRSATSDHR
jgi:hypothetical protein